MMENLKNRLLAGEIEKILQKGIDLSTDVMNFIDSTYGNPSFNEIEKIIKDRGSAEAELLLELIFFPDEDFQIKLEQHIEKHVFFTKDQETLCNLICDKKPLTKIHFPGKSESLIIPVTHTEINHFLCRLKITRNLNKRISEVIIKNIYDESISLRIRVKLRNSRFIYSESKTDFLCSFFEVIESDKANFYDILTYTLHFLETIGNDSDIYQALMKRKMTAIQSLQMAISFENKIKQNNIETLILQGITPLSINKDDLLKQIEMVDKISLSVFGKTDNYEEPLPYTFNH
ncbi:MAG: hypothetical protein HN737_05910 [Desulfobacterales bacterium]|nr:hypothetical protein [Desulfobacteraceae bacterium]MBT4363991.1 hypothetical protein [Desulfobacteraceae bacterium]MBT7084840.1 hypothetical protein [Desulfobacterales bacterium]MBT7696926.1 hypothetical protein [Desulfobacterales bacterium]